MAWRVVYHHSVSDDLEALGRAQARAILKVITTRIQNGEPDKTGKPLSGLLAGFRRVRTGNTRIVYRVNKKSVEILIVAVGRRRDSEVYIKAEERIE